jgi:hypothetical protein
MCSARGSAALPALGFPIRASAGHRLFSASPRLIAAVHALHRLLVPRHPPCALPILTVISCRPRAMGRQPVIPVVSLTTMQFSRSAEATGAGAGSLESSSGSPACAGLSKLNSMQRARAQRYAELARSGLVDVPGRSGVADRVGPATTKVAGARGAFPIGFHYGTP